MSRLPTVRVVNPSQSDSYVIINESDFDSSQHQLYDSPILPKPAEIPPSEAQRGGSDTAAAALGVNGSSGPKPAGWDDVARANSAAVEEMMQNALRVAKGPGGKWFVWRGKQIVSGRLDSEDAAVEALRNMREPVA